VKGPPLAVVLLVLAMPSAVTASTIMPIVGCVENATGSTPMQQLSSMKVEIMAETLPWDPDVYAEVEGRNAYYLVAVPGDDVNETTLKVQPLLIPIPKDCAEISTTSTGQVLKVITANLEVPGYCLTPGAPVPGNGTYLYLVTWNDLESKEALLVKPDCVETVMETGNVSSDWVVATHLSKDWIEDAVKVVDSNPAAVTSFDANVQLELAKDLGEYATSTTTSSSSGTLSLAGLIQGLVPLVTLAALAAEVLAFLTHPPSHPTPKPEVSEIIIEEIRYYHPEESATTSATVSGATTKPTGKKEGTKATKSRKASSAKSAPGTTRGGSPTGRTSVRVPSAVETTPTAMVTGERVVRGITGNPGGTMNRVGIPARVPVGVTTAVEMGCPAGKPVIATGRYRGRGIVGGYPGGGLTAGSYVTGVPTVAVIAALICAVLGGFLVWWGRR